MVDPSRRPIDNFAETVKDPLRHETRALLHALPDRYAVGGELGRGSTATVFEAHDTALDRVVAIKQLRQVDEDGRQSFLREARVSASLDHPNIVPVYDIQSQDTAPSFLVMRRIRGGSLGETIRSAGEDRRPVAIASVAATVGVFVKAAEALSRAHSLGIVHRDIKPDNIMIGEHGEVMVADWGEALSLREPAKQGRSGTVGTPLYMSPEQARGEGVTPASDVYALAGSLLHALTLRPPLNEPDPESFWRRRRSGDIDWPTAAERFAIGKQLTAVLTKALARSPQDRYPDAEAFAAELRRYQQGLSISAYSPGPLERLTSLLARYRGRLALCLLIVAALASAGWYVYGERMRQVARWGYPVVSGFPLHTTEPHRWESDDAASWTIADGVATSRSETANLLTFSRVLSPRMAIEYTGTMGVDSLPGDLSVRWSEYTADPKVAPGWLIQAGAYQNEYCAIYRMPSYERVAYAPVRLVPGRKHSFRVEIDGRHLSLAIDGRLVLSHEAEVSVLPGRLSLYAYHPGKGFSDVRVFERHPPELVSAIAVGEALYTADQFDAAERSWSQVASAHAAGDLGNHAVFLQGMAALRSGREADALSAWSRLSPGPWEDKAELQRLQLLWTQGRSADIRIRLMQVIGRSPRMQAEVSNLWQRVVRLSGTFPPAEQEARLSELLRLRRSILPEDRASGQQAVFAHLRMGSAAEGLSDPGIAGSDRAWLLLRAGRARDVAEDPQGLLEARTKAFLDLGQPERALELPGQSASSRAWLLDLMGRSDAVRQMLADPAVAAALARRADETALAGATSPQKRSDLLYRLERWESAHDQPSLASLYRMGRYTEARRVDHVMERRLQSSWLETIETGDDPRSFAEAVRGWRDVEHWFLPMFALPMLESLAGDDQSWPQALRHAEGMTGRFTRMPMLIAAYAAGRIGDEEVLAMPCRLYGPACLALATALRAEVARDPSARTAWQKFLALPARMRSIESGNPSPLLERFAEVRSRP
jgi:hypothetical protein